MENNSNSANLEIKQETENSPDESRQDFISSCLTIKIEVEGAAPEPIQQLCESINPKVVTNFSESLQDSIGTIIDLGKPANKVSWLNKVSGQTNKSQIKNNMKQQKGIDNSDIMLNTEPLPVAQILVDEKPNLNNNNVKEEVKGTNEINKSNAEDSDSLWKPVSRRKIKSNEVLIETESSNQPHDTAVCKRRQAQRKTNKNVKSGGISDSIHVTTRANKLPKKNSQKPHNDDADSISSSDENTLSDSDFQDLFDPIKPKKRKYRSRQKQLTEEEKAEKERQKLERRTCQICGAVFALPDGLRNHIRSKHTFEKPYSCKICSEQFSTRSSHSFHRRRHHGFQPFLCNLCGKTFLLKAHMEVHMRIHIPSKDKIRDVKCSLCPNVYTSKLNLKKHMLTKHIDPTEWQHECNVCRKKCFSTTDLTHHMRRHNDERRYKCVICGRGFFTKQTMNVHFRTHSANTAFNCGHCAKGYRSKEALQHHMLKLHGIGEEKTVSPPKHFCPICNEGFRQRARLEKHLVIHETGEEEYPFKCEKCNKHYKARNYFTIHMLEKHKEFLDDSYFKTHFKVNSQGNYESCDEVVDIKVGTSDDP